MLFAAPAWLTCLAVVILVIIGAIFEQLGAKFGLLVAVMAHSGGDTVIAMVASDVVWPWI